MAERIRRTNYVGDYLAAHGFPARATYSRQIAILRQADADRYSALYYYLPGKTIPWEAYTKEHIKLLGKTMSDMHALLAAAHVAGATNIVFPEVADEYLAIIRRMQRYFAQETVVSALSAKLSLGMSPTWRKHEAVVAACKKLPGQQVLHMDFVRSNILFAPVLQPTDRYSFGGCRISGILDFEKAAFGHPLFDIARTMAFLLVDCKYKQPDKIRKYFLHSGYDKRGAAPYPGICVRDSQGARTPLLERLVDLFLLYDFYKFLRHNPYESLPQNEHFVRTRDILLGRGCLRWTE